MQARIWKETVMIPTYEVGEPNANPMFFENRVYQGSSGKVYPYPIIETVKDTKKDTPYEAVFLENQYLKVMVLPQLGGRIHRILDKTNGEDVVYHNEVIKPALVGLLGPWISGGIEFNWPQHHRPTTFMPVEYRIEETMRSVSILLSDTDCMYGTKSIATITLYQDKAYVEIQGQLYNPTPFTQTFLWWANPAISVNDHTQSIFPPDVHAVMDHGKRDVSSFPIATGIYYKHDYSEGVDISRYKNIPVPTSYMAYHSDYDFVGSYDHQKQIGILHVADHHISPGKKQWTWGCGDFGKAWDRNLTDENGPYIELMTGVFTDNQPDFSFLESGEEKTFTQYFFPYKKAPRVCNATKDLVLSVSEEKETKNYEISLYASCDVGNIKLIIKTASTVLISHELHLAPTECFSCMVESAKKEQEGKALKHNSTYSVSVLSSLDETLLSYTIQNTEEQTPTPEPMKAIQKPQELESVEALYLAAVHLEQYRHATFRSEDYYREALLRDSGDYRCNTGYGELLLKKGLAIESESFFRRAIERITKHNPNPRDSQAHSLLGLSLLYQERYSEAYDVFYKAIWDGKQQELGYLYLGMLEIRKAHYKEAAQFLRLSLVRNSHNLKTRGYLALSEMELGNEHRAFKIIEETLSIDPFDVFALDLKNNGKEKPKTYYNLLALASLYAEVGLYERALLILEQEDEENPMLLYHQAWYALKLQKTEKVVGALKKAEGLADSTFFPNTLEDLKVLQSLADYDERLWKIHYLVGSYWYDKREHQRAKQAWECANKHNPDHAKTLRCLALVYFNIDHDHQKAREAMLRAVELDPEDDRLLFELDQLDKKCAIAIEKRKERLEGKLNLVHLRDDLMVEYCTLLNLLGEYEKARKLEITYSFHPWEGGEGKITTQYVVTHVELAKEALKNQQSEKAKELLLQALTYPENLHEGKLEGTKDNEVHYLLGCVFEQENNQEKAKHHWNLATRGALTASGALYYYDQSPHQLYYKALALRKLGKETEAQSIFDELISYGKGQLDASVSIDFFAVSLPDLQVFTDDLDKRNQVHCYYLIALGNLGKGKAQEAQTALETVLEIDPGHWEAKRHLYAIA